MRVLRPFVWAAVLVAGFLVRHVGGALGRGARRCSPSGRRPRLWSEPASAASAGFYTADEQNNIDIYRGAARRHGQHHVEWSTAKTGSSACIQSEGAGSGFIINPDGEILTNYHVVNGGTAQLTVTLSDKKTYKAKILGTDRSNDLALIKIDAGRKLPVAAAGRFRSPGGRPEGARHRQSVRQFGGTLTTGIVSSLGRTDSNRREQQLEGMIQTDAAINPGNSGGPLLDSHGNVIGINTAIYGAQGNIGLGFAHADQSRQGDARRVLENGPVFPALLWELARCRSRSSWRKPSICRPKPVCSCSVSSRLRPPRSRAFEGPTGG